MYAIRIVLVCLAGLSFAFPHARGAEGRQQTVELGGPRRAKAVVDDDGSDYLIETQMLAVVCFDPLTNSCLNEQKARLLALRALGRYLFGEKPIRFAVAGSRVESTAGDGDWFRLTLRLPGDKVRLLNPAEGVEPTGERSELVKNASSLFTRSQDYEETIEQIVFIHRARLREALELESEGFYLAVAELEETGSRNLARLAAEINADLVLVSVEREPLAARVEAEIDRLQGALAEAVNHFESDQEKEPVPP